MLVPEGLPAYGKRAVKTNPVPPPLPSPSSPQRELMEISHNARAHQLLQARQRGSVCLSALHKANVSSRGH